MALNHLPSLVLRVAPSCVDHEAGLRNEFAAMVPMPATLSLPGRFVPGFAAVVMEPRSAWVGTDEIGTARAVRRAGRPQSLAGVPGTAILGRNPRGSHPSRWSRPFQASSINRCYRGKPMAYVQG